MSALVWENEPLDTIGEILNAASKAEREGKAQEFLAAYRKVNPEHADANLGYLIGYMEPRERRAQMYAAYQLTHPIFGGTAS